MSKNIKAGYGYRLLGPDETIVEHDEYYHAPPVGLKPRVLWLEQTIDQEKQWASERSRRQEARHGEVVAAIRRYVDANIAIPAEWMQEYFDYLSTRTKIE